MQLYNAELVPLALLFQGGDEVVLSGSYPLATHRVTIPEDLALEGHRKEETTSARCSIPYPVSPDLGLMNSCMDAGKSASYETATFAAYRIADGNNHP